MNITIQEAKEKREKVKKAIENLIENFEKDTGLEVSFISITHHRTLAGKSEAVSVSVETVMN